MAAAVCGERLRGVGGVNGRAYRDDLGGGVFDDGEALPGDPACPTCRKVTSVQRVGAMWWCTDCDLAFDEGDHERVSPDWVKTYRDLRAEQSTPRDKREAS